MQRDVAGVKKYRMVSCINKGVIYFCYTRQALICRVFLIIWYESILQFMDYLHQLVSQTDCISLGYKYNPVEGVGNDKDR